MKEVTMAQQEKKLRLCLKALMEAPLGPPENRDIHRESIDSTERKRIH
jgi:hypothetical protein